MISSENLDSLVEEIVPCLGQSPLGLSLNRLLALAVFGGIIGGASLSGTVIGSFILSTLAMDLTVMNTHNPPHAPRRVPGPDTEQEVGGSPYRTLTTHKFPDFHAVSRSM